MENILIDSEITTHLFPVSLNSKGLEPISANIAVQIEEPDNNNLVLSSEYEYAQKLNLGGQILLEYAATSNNEYVQEQLAINQPLFLSSSIDDILKPSNISPVLLEETLNDPLWHGSTNSTNSPLYNIEKSLITISDARERKETETNILLTSEIGKVAYLNLEIDQAQADSGYSGHFNEWQIDQILYGDTALQEHERAAFAIDYAVPGLQNYKDNKLYIQAKVEGINSEPVINIEILDNRETNIDLTGLNLDISWETSSLSLNKDNYTTENVFEGVAAPLFQSIGTLHLGTSAYGAERQLISGLTAASLPISGTGGPLGKTTSQGEPKPTLFSSVPVVPMGKSESVHIDIAIKEAIQTGGVQLRSDEVIILTSQQEKPVLRIEQSQLSSGVYTIDVKNGFDMLNRFYITVSDIKSNSNEKDSLQYIQPMSEDSINQVPVFSSKKPSSPLYINSSDAAPIAPGVWRQTVALQQDQALWEMNFEHLFPEIEQYQGLDVLLSGKLPSWVRYANDGSHPLGSLTGRPTNLDIGTSTSHWTFIDQHGQNANFLLDLHVENKNDAPVARRNGEPIFFEVDTRNANHSKSLLKRLDLSQLFTDADQIWGDTLSYTIVNIKDLTTDNLVDLECLRLTSASTELSELKNNVDLRPRLFLADHSEVLQEISIGDLDRLPIGTVVHVEIVVSDNRDDVEPGLIAVDFDINISNSLKVTPDSIKLSPLLPLFHKSALSNTPLGSNFSSLTIQAGSMPGFGIGSVVGDRSHTIANFDLTVVSPDALHSISIKPGEGKDRDGIIDQLGNTVDSTSISLNSLSSHATSFLDFYHDESPANGQYVVSIEATDASGAKARFDLPVLIGSTADLHSYQQEISSAVLKQMTPEAILEMLKGGISSYSSLKKTQQIALAGLSNLSSVPATFMHEAINADKFHFSNNYYYDIPRIALFTQDNTSIDSLSIEQYQAHPILQILKEENEDFQVPIGAVEFSVKTDESEPTSVVNILLAENGVRLNRLLKTSHTGEVIPLNISPLEVPRNLSESEISDWFRNLTYPVYDYSIDGGRSTEIGSYSASVGISIKGQDKSLAELRTNRALDGSGYYIDLNNDGLTDLLSLALIDQGFFDLDPTSNIIKDPLIPIYSPFVAELSQNQALLRPEALLPDTPFSSYMKSSEPKYEHINNTTPRFVGASSSTQSSLDELYSSQNSRFPVIDPAIIDTSNMESYADQDNQTAQPEAGHPAITPVGTGGGSSPDSSKPLVTTISSDVPVESNDKSTNFGSSIINNSRGIEGVELQKRPVDWSTILDHSESVLSPNNNSSLSSSILLDLLANLQDLAKFNQDNSDHPSTQQSFIGDILNDLGDLSVSLLATLGLVSFSQLSQAPHSALRRLKKQYPLSVLHRSDDTALQISIPDQDVIVSIIGGLLSITEGSTSESSEAYFSESPMSLHSLFNSSESPGLFIHSCLFALQQLSTTNVEAVNWSKWIANVTKSTSSRHMSKGSQEDIKLMLRGIQELSHLSPSLLDIRMAASLTAVLLSCGYAASDLPGYKATP